MLAGSIRGSIAPRIDQRVVGEVDAYFRSLGILGKENQVWEG